MGQAPRSGRIGHVILAVAVVAAAVVVQDAIAAANSHWYAGLLKPAFAPAPWLAGAASIVLGVALAYGFVRVLRRPDYLPDRPAAIRAFLAGLALDILWAWLFFAGRHPSVALAAAAVLTMTATAAAWRFAVVDRRAGLSLLPWVLATGFTFLLDLSIAIRNG